MEFKANGDYEIYYSDPNYSNETCPGQITYTILENPDETLIIYYCEEELFSQADFYITEHDELIFTGPLQRDKWVWVSE